MLRVEKPGKFAWMRERQWWLVPSLFLAYLILGVTIFDDYGLSWDEDAARSRAGQNVLYVANGHDGIFQRPGGTYHGPAFSIGLLACEYGLGWQDEPHKAYRLNHLLTFLLYYLSVICFYMIAKRFFRSRWPAILSVVMLVITPRIFAHSFYNPKDIPFMAVFVIGVLTLWRLAENMRWPWAIAHGAVCAFLVDVRIIGVLLVALSVSVLAARSMRKGGAGIRRGMAARGMAASLIFALSFLTLAVLFWPLLWKDTGLHVFKAFTQMSEYPWAYTVLYFGRFIKATELPWHYVPVWMLITLPVTYLVSAVLGVVVVLADTIRGECSQRPEKVFLLAWFCIPLFMATAMGAVLYDAWRHFFFMYPAFVLLAVSGLVWLFRYLAGRTRILAALLVVIVAGDILATAAAMAMMHPYENVYFNSIARRLLDAEDRFELDYWGLSYRKGLEIILSSDESTAIPVFVEDRVGRFNAQILYPEERSRLEFVDDPSRAVYYVTIHRWRRTPPEGAQLLYSLVVNRARIMSVYRLQGANRL